MFSDNYLSRNLSEKLMSKQFERNDINLNKSDVYNTFQAWKHIDLKMVNENFVLVIFDN